MLPPPPLGVGVGVGVGVGDGTPHLSEIYTDSTHNLKLPPDSLAAQSQRPSEHNLNPAPTHPDPAPTKAAELEIEGPQIDLGGLIL